MPPIASTRREQSAGLFREALRRFVWKRQGGGSHPPPPTPAKVAKHGLRARVNQVLVTLLRIQAFYVCIFLFYRSKQNATFFDVVKTPNIRNVKKVGKWLGS